MTTLMATQRTGDCTQILQFPCTVRLHLQKNLPSAARFLPSPCLLSPCRSCCWLLWSQLREGSHRYQNHSAIVECCSTDYCHCSDYLSSLATTGNSRIEMSYARDNPVLYGRNCRIPGLDHSYGKLGFASTIYRMSSVLLCTIRG